LPSAFALAKGVCSRFLQQASPTHSAIIPWFWLLEGKKGQSEFQLDKLIFDWPLLLPI